MNAVFEGNKAVGASVRRVEDPRYLEGRASYVDDLQSAGLLHLAFVRTSNAHAKVVDVDVTSALEVPGVVAAYTADDLAGLMKPILAESSLPGYNASFRPALATDRVRFVGEAVAAVLAESRYAAEDGVDAVVLDEEPLPVVTSIEDALAPGAPLIHDDLPSNVHNHFHLVEGDVEGAFAAADLVVEREFRSQRVAPVPLEPRSMIARWDPAGPELTLWISHQAPHMLRTGISRFMDLPESSIRVVSPDVGGGFGAKLILYTEDLVVAAVSRLSGRPVKWISDRREDLLTTMHGREQIHHVAAAVRADGRVLGVRVKIMASNGAYAVWPMTAGLDSGQASENVTGPYDIPNYERDVYAVCTNKAPMGPYRGVGRPMACFTIERLMDEIGREVGVEPLEVRRRNVVRTYPYETPTGLRFESGSSAESIELIDELLGVAEFRTEQRRLRERGVYAGLGVAAMVEHTALGPDEVSRKGIDMVLGMESASLAVEPDGRVTVQVGTHSHGQGHETTFAQVVADELSISHEDVRIRFGDTAAVPYGLGTWASRSTVYAGGAAILAARQVRDKVLEIGAHLLEASPGDLELVDGSIQVKGSPGRGLSFRDVAYTAIHKPNLLPPEIEPGLNAVRRYKAPDPGSFTNAIHAALVEVDVATGVLSIRRYVVIEDCGVMINPMIVEGQVHGGVAQGLGHAILEDMHYDELGQPLTTTFMDYLLPGFNEVPTIEIHHLESPSPHSLGGFKGMGEGGAINPPAVIANAVTDALEPFGIRVDSTPVTADWILARLAEAGETHTTTGGDRG
jgi:carbon-monoxide dehydrogenase large subunit